MWPYPVVITGPADMADEAAYFGLQFNAGAAADYAAGGEDGFAGYTDADDADWDEFYTSTWLNDYLEQSTWAQVPHEHANGVARLGVRGPRG